MCETSRQPILTGDSGSRRKNSRKKIWQLDVSFHCCIIGTCLTMDELRLISKKHLLKTTNNTCDYELHSAFVYMVQYSNETAHYCQKYLDKKYRSLIKKYAGLKSDSEFQLLWQRASASGDVAGTYWTLVTHPNTSSAFCDKIYGDVHMLSHLSGASARTDIKTLGKLRHEKTKLEQRFSEQSEMLYKRLQKKQTQIDTLKDKVTLCEQDAQKIRDLKSRVRELELNNKKPANNTTNGLPIIASGTSIKIGILEKKNYELEEQIAKEKEANRLLDLKLTEGLTERNAAENCLQALLVQNCDKACNAIDMGSDPSINLDGQYILYVGGRVNQCRYFRLLVEQRNGSFLHHDGGREQGPSKLNGDLAKADAVVCPIDCISHSAFKSVKTHCVKQQKQLIMIAHASLASFTKGLSEVVV